MPQVGSNIPESTHDVSLSDGGETYYFNLTGDTPAVDQNPQTPSTIVIDRRGREFGTWNPNFAHIQQATWVGGRGQYRFHDDESRYFDSKMLWTFTPGRIHPVPEWRLTEGYVSMDNALHGATAIPVGHNILWEPLLDQKRYARKFTASASYTAAVGNAWIRKRGAPAGNLTFALYNDSSGSPGTLQSSATLAASDFSDEVSTLAEWTLSQALTSGTDYWVVIWDASNDSDTNHFELGYSDGGNADLYKTSTNGTDWTAESTVQIMFRLSVARIGGKWHYFHMEGGFYKVSERRSGSGADLFINGDRGIATAGAASTLTDSTKSWTTNIWANARVRITKGAGAGQHRGISSNTGTVLTVDAAWDVNPTSTSEYVTYATDRWTDITLATDDTDDPVKSVAVIDNQAIFAYGSTTGSEHVMLRARWNSAGPNHQGDDDGTNRADFVWVDHDRVDGPQVWRAENDTVDVSRSDTKAWATALSFGTAIKAGDQTWKTTGGMAYEGKIYIRKEDGIGYIVNDRYIPLRVGLDTMAEQTNGLAAAIWNLALYFNWSYSLEQLYGANLDDVGAWLNAGLPAGRRGIHGSLLPLHALLVSGMDAGTARTSSVLAWNKIGYGELFRSWKSGLRVEEVAWQSCPGTQDRLWMSVGGESVVMEFADESLNMLEDSGVNYHNEAVLETSEINMDAHNIKKLFKQLSLTTQNLDNDTYVIAEYQVDNDIGGTIWKGIGDYRMSDFQTLPINEGNRRRIKIRLRLITQDADVPPVCLAWVLEAFARTPVKYQWAVRAMSKGLTRVAGNEVDHDPDKFVIWLKRKGQDASDIVMHSRWAQLDNGGLGERVIVEPPSILQRFQNRINRRKGIELTLAIRES